MFRRKYIKLLEAALRKDGTIRATPPNASADVLASCLNVRATATCFRRMLLEVKETPPALPSGRNEERP